MINDPLQMLRGLIVLAPELNTKIALLNLVDYFDATMDDLGDDGGQIQIDDILNVLSESLVKLHHHVYDDMEGEFPVSGGSYDGSGKKMSFEDLDEFRRILGIIPETGETEENNGR
jgi:hypothetical protein